MIEEAYVLGKINILKIKKLVDFGVYLTDKYDYEEILLPQKYLPETYNIDDEIEVFVYLDSEDRVIATTLKPNGVVDDFCLMKIVDTNKVGVFADWGLEKDLFIPFSEQNKKMFKDRSYVIKILLDAQSDRIFGSAKLDKYLLPADNELKEEQEVKLTVWDITELGYKVIINNKYNGVLYKNETYIDIFIGDKLIGFIKKIRSDGKIDVKLSLSQLDDIQKAQSEILKLLNLEKGFIKLNDSSSPEDVKKMLQISKKVFKKAVGGLLKTQTIIFVNDGIKLNDNE